MRRWFASTASRSQLFVRTFKTVRVADVEGEGRFSGVAEIANESDDAKEGRGVAVASRGAETAHEFTELGEEVESGVHMDMLGKVPCCILLQREH